MKTNIQKTILGLSVIASIFLTSCGAPETEPTNPPSSSAESGEDGKLESFEQGQASTETQAPTTTGSIGPTVDLSINISDANPVAVNSHNSAANDSDAESDDDSNSSASSSDSSTGKSNTAGAPTTNTTNETGTIQENTPTNNSNSGTTVITTSGPTASDSDDSEEPEATVETTTQTQNEPPRVNPADGLTAIFVHGRITQDLSDCQDQTSCPQGGWPNELPPGSVTVGYDGSLHPLKAGNKRGQTQLLKLLNKYCRKDQGQACRLVGESMGGLITAATIGRFTNEVYNIVYTTQIQSAEGGADVASLGEFGFKLMEIVLGWWTPIDEWVSDLASMDSVYAVTVAGARSQVEFNDVGGVQFYNVVGHKTAFPIDQLTPGKDDNLIGFHSTCSYRQHGAYDRCMGQSFTQCTFLFFGCKDVLMLPFDNRHMYPGASIYGENDGHGKSDKKRWGQPLPSSL